MPAFKVVFNKIQFVFFHGMEGNWRMKMKESPDIEESENRKMGENYN